MSEEAALTERYDPSGHEVADFGCGEESLDRWLHRYAGQGERHDTTRIFVATDERRVVRGYYTLVAGQLEHAEATEAARKASRGTFRSQARSSPALRSTSAVRAKDSARLCSTTPLTGYAAPRRRSPCERWSYMRSTTRRLVSTSASASAASVPPRALMVTLAELHEAGYGR